MMGPISQQQHAPGDPNAPVPNKPLDSA